LWRPDVVWAEISDTDEACRKWLQHGLLKRLSARYVEHGVALSWDESFFDWLMDNRKNLDDARDWERFVDGCLGPLLIAHVDRARVPETKSLVVRCCEGIPEVQMHQSEGKE